MTAGPSPAPSTLQPFGARTGAGVPAKSSDTSRRGQRRSRRRGAGSTERRRQSIGGGVRRGTNAGMQLGQGRMVWDVGHGHEGRREPPWPGAVAGLRVMRMEGHGRRRQGARLDVESSPPRCRSPRAGQSPGGPHKPGIVAHGARQPSSPSTLGVTPLGPVARAPPPQRGPPQHAHLVLRGRCSAPCAAGPGATAGRFGAAAPLGWSGGLHVDAGDDAVAGACLTPPTALVGTESPGASGGRVESVSLDRRLRAGQRAESGAAGRGHRRPPAPPHLAFNERRHLGISANPTPPGPHHGAWPPRLKILVVRSLAKGMGPCEQNLTNFLGGYFGGRSPLGS